MIFFSKTYSCSRRIHLKRFQSDSGSLKIRNRVHKISCQKKTIGLVHLVPLKKIQSSHRRMTNHFGVLKVKWKSPPSFYRVIILVCSKFFRQPSIILVNHSSFLFKMWLPLFPPARIDSKFRKLGYLLHLIAQSEVISYTTGVSRRI